MRLKELVHRAADKGNFTALSDYLDFSTRFLTFLEHGLQAVIVSQNESHYRFFQYKQEGHFNVTRPINSHLMYSSQNADTLRKRFLDTLRNARDIAIRDSESRQVICRSIYTIQQSIGAALDALPAGQSNTARKINGDLFERLMLLLVQTLGVDCRSGVVNIPVLVDGVEQFRMSYQHDLVLRTEEELKAIGSVKTSSKDRLDKIFIDKFLYSRLTDTEIPHFAIFLNDVQRKKTKKDQVYGINATFLPGHFKVYTVKLNALDGVYYCDIRPNMCSDPMLSSHIRTIDHFFCGDLWQMLR
ncbi:MAG: hypothetical protein ABR915_06640 [Thermoguttaceae bacterium]|jgi:hypothetical protein